MDKIRKVTDMPVYQLFYDLAIRVEKITRQLKKDFWWLRIQCLRSSESVIANMTEGFYSQYSTEYLQCLYRSRREARETMGHMRYALDVGQLCEKEIEVLLENYEAALMQLSYVIRSIERKIEERGKSKSSQIKESGIEYFLYDEPTIDHQP